MRAQENKEDKMHIIYNAKLRGWQIVYTPNNFTNPDLWGKPVNDKIYESWDEAAHMLDKWAS